MLSDQEASQVMQALAVTAEMLGQEIKPTTAAVMASDLSRYPAGVILKALSRLRSSMDGRLTLKSVIDIIEEGAGRLTANEAWSLALSAQDEAVTVVWTDEIQSAWGTARPIMDLGDKVGARMAFVAAYDRLVKDARDSGRLPVWSASLGWDVEQRKQELSKAVQDGRLPAPTAQLMLPPPDAPADPVGQSLIREKLSELADELRANSEAARLRRAEQVEAERQAFEQRKQAVIDKLEELQDVNEDQ